MEIVKKLMPFVILIATLSFVLVSSFGINNQLLTETTINGIHFYKFDLNKYVQSIQYIWNSYTPTWEDITISTNIRSFPNSLNVLDYFRVFGHNFFVVVGWFMAPISILTWFGNFIIFAVQMLLALIGFPYNSSLMIVMEFIKELANIPNIVINAIQNIL